MATRIRPHRHPDCPDGPGHRWNGRHFQTPHTSLPANGALNPHAARTLLVGLNTPLTAAGNALTLYFQPLLDWHGSTTFDFVATDNNGASSASAIGTINVASVYDGLPWRTPTPITWSRHTVHHQHRIAVFKRNVLPDAAAFLSFTAPVGGGTLINNGDGTLTYTGPAAPGTATFTYTIQDDGAAGTSVGTVTLNIGAASTDLAIVDESALSAPAGSGGGTDHRNRQCPDDGWRPARRRRHPAHHRQRRDDLDHGQRRGRPESEQRGLLPPTHRVARLRSTSRAPTRATTRIRWFRERTTRLPPITAASASSSATTATRPMARMRSCA